MKVGLTGFPGSGKTTVFNAMTGLAVPVGFGGEVHLGTARVSDPRIARLSALYRPKKTTFSEVTFCDLPGEHGSERTGLSPRTLQRLREQDALCLVSGDFSETDESTPVADLTAFHEECLLADLDIASRRLERLRKERGPPLEVGTFERAVEALEDEQPLRSLGDDELHRSFLKGFGMLTDRPLLAIVNVEEQRAAEPLDPTVEAELSRLFARGMALSASVESDIASMPREERDEFLEYVGVEESALDRFIRLAYDTLDLISFFTVGPDEVRAWPIRRGTAAKAAAGTIHSDLERGFIRAEVTPWDDLLECGSEAEAKKAGLMRVEGKSYVLVDGEVMHVRFNV